VTLNRSKRSPACLAIHDARLLGQREWIGKYAQSEVKVDPVFTQIRGRFGGAHSNRVVIDKCYYIIVFTSSE
jgi:hypothetical protein